MELNRLAPDFELPDLRGNRHRLTNYRGRIVIVNFWSAECAYSIRADDVTFRQRIPTRFYLERAVDALFTGRLPEPAPAYSCAIVREI